MFEKKKSRMIITISEDRININGGYLTVGECMQIIIGIANMIEEKTGVKSYEILSKCAFELI